MQHRIMVMAIAVTALMAFTSAHAQTVYPNRPVRVVVPFTPGGAADIVARTIGQKLGERLGQSFVIDNKPGAGGAIAADAVAKAPADGYTLLVADMGQLAINPAMNAHLPYQPARDFEPLSSVAVVPQFLAVNSASPITSVQSLVDYAKAHPGLAYGTPGIGTSHHLELEALNMGAGLGMTHVPYKGGAQTIPALIGGEIGLTVSALGALRPQVAAGRIRLIGVTSGARSPLEPGVPSVSDTLPGYDLSDVVGFLAPARTPAAIVERLNAEIVAVGRSPDVVARLSELGLEAKVTTPAGYAAMIGAASQSFGKLVKELKITAD